MIITEKSRQPIDYTFEDAEELYACIDVLWDAAQAYPYASSMYIITHIYRNKLIRLFNKRCHKLDRCKIVYIPKHKKKKAGLLV